MKNAIHLDVDVVLVGSKSTMLRSFAALRQKAEQNPLGAATFDFLSVYLRG